MKRGYNGKMIRKQILPEVPVVGFPNGKSFKDYLVRATPPKTNETGRCEPCEKKPV